MFSSICSILTLSGIVAIDYYPGRGKDRLSVLSCMTADRNALHILRGEVQNERAN